MANDVTRQALQWIAQYKDEVTTPLEVTSGRIAKAWQSITGVFRKSAITINETDKAIVDSLESVHGTISSFNTSIGRSSEAVRLMFGSFGVDLRSIEKDVAILHALGRAGGGVLTELSATFVEAQGGVENFSNRLISLGTTAPKQFAKVVEALTNLFGIDISPKLQDTLIHAIAGAGSKAFKALGIEAGVELSPALQKAFEQGSTAVRRIIVEPIFKSTSIAETKIPVGQELREAQNAVQGFTGSVQDAKKDLQSHTTYFIEGLKHLSASLGIHTDVIGGITPGLAKQFSGLPGREARVATTAADAQTGILSRIATYTIRSFISLLKMISIFGPLGILTKAIWELIEPFIQIFNLLVSQLIVQLQDVLFELVNKLGPKIDTFLKVYSEKGLWQAMFGDKGMYEVLFGPSTQKPSDQAYGFAGSAYTVERVHEVLPKPSVKYMTPPKPVSEGDIVRELNAEHTKNMQRMLLGEDTYPRTRPPILSPIAQPSFEGPKPPPKVVPEIEWPRPSREYMDMQHPTGGSLIPSEGIVPPDEKSIKKQISLLEDMLSSQVNYYELIRNESNLFRDSEAEFTSTQVSLSQFRG